MKKQKQTKAEVGFAQLVHNYKFELEFIKHQAEWFLNSLNQGLFLHYASGLDIELDFLINCMARFMFKINRTAWKYSEYINNDFKEVMTSQTILYNKIDDALQKVCEQNLTYGEIRSEWNEKIESMIDRLRIRFNDDDQKRLTINCSF